MYTGKKKFKKKPTTNKKVYPWEPRFRLNRQRLEVSFINLFKELTETVSKELKYDVDILPKRISVSIEII